MNENMTPSQKENLRLLLLCYLSPKVESVSSKRIPRKPRRYRRVRSRAWRKLRA